MNIQSFSGYPFNEALRVLKPTGLLYINAPSNGAYHRYPVDCWRFYPDSGVALQNWGNRSGYECALLEFFIGVRKKIFGTILLVFLSKIKNTLQNSLRGFKIIQKNFEWAITKLRGNF